MAKKTSFKQTIGGNKLASEKIKVEGIKRRKRRMKLKAKGNNDAIIERFSAQSSKQAKYAKTTVRKRDASEPAQTSASFAPAKKSEPKDLDRDAPSQQTKPTPQP